VKKVDLNVDIGEGFPHDEALLEFATSANVCFGEHAGSQELTFATAEGCKGKNIRVGAHPGYPDREFMGRRSIVEQDTVTQAKWLDSVREQIRLAHHSTLFDYLKPHGALYNDTAIPIPEDLTPWGAVNSENPIYAWIAQLHAPAPLRFLEDAEKPLMGLPGTTHEIVGWTCDFIAEGFADRRYRHDGTLVSRSEPNAILHDKGEIREQVLRLAPRVDSICLHGDTPNCLEFAELVYKTLKDAGYEVGY